MSIAPIQTTYGGYRFRSRLEARWAIFFDHVGITWKYEPQGFMVGQRWESWDEEDKSSPSTRDERIPYLPDFYLPNLDLWIEVKGDDATVDWPLLGAAVDGSGDHLPCKHVVDTDYGYEGPFGSITSMDREGAPALLVLGDIPDPEIVRTFPILLCSKGGVYVDEWIWTGEEDGPLAGRFSWQGGPGRPFSNKTSYIMPFYDGICADDAKSWRPGAEKSDDYYYVSVHGRSLHTVKNAPKVRTALAIARSARFEHGETPNRPGAARPGYIRMDDLLNRLLLIKPTDHGSRNGKEEGQGAYEYIVCDVTVMDGPTTESMSEIPSTLKDFHLSGVNIISTLKPKLKSGGRVLGRLVQRKVQGYSTFIWHLDEPTLEDITNTRAYLKAKRS
jgi:hypothetical protein